MRFSILVAGLALASLAGCSGSGPVTMNSGVGFGDYQEFLRNRDMAAPSQARAPYSVPPERAGLPPPPLIAARPIQATPRPVPQPAPPAIAMAPQPAPGAPLVAPMRSLPVPGGVQASGSPVAPRTAPAPSPVAVAEAPRQQVSNEQDFLAVLNRPASPTTGAQAGAVIATAPVTGIPDADVQAGPNIMAYALAFDHPVGVERFRRMNPLRWRQWEAACLQFRTQEDAQRAFLSAGGPQRDGGNLDPDGDGYACWWDPAPYRRAMQATQTARR